MASKTIYVPVRPTPALQWTTIGPALLGLADEDFLIKFKTGNGSDVPNVVVEKIESVQRINVLICC